MQLAIEVTSELNSFVSKILDLQVTQSSGKCSSRSRAESGFVSVHQRGPTQGFHKKIGLTGHPLSEKNALRTKCFCL